MDRQPRPTILEPCPQGGSIELIAIETPDNVIVSLASALRLDGDEAAFNANWLQCLDKVSILFSFDCFLSMFFLLVFYFFNYFFLCQYLL